MDYLPKLIDNDRVTLKETLIKIAAEHDVLSVATGYLDLTGILDIYDSIKNYKSIRILLGKEPIAPRILREIKANNLYVDFPARDIEVDLSMPELLTESDQLRVLITDIKRAISENRLEIKIIKDDFLHAKCYIFGDRHDQKAVGIVGSSNFTRAGLSKNLELNTPEREPMVVKHDPNDSKDENGHLSWYDGLWNSNKAIDWNGDFFSILENSQVGDLTFGAYDVYIKTLMELFPDELVPKADLSKSIKDVLYTFQNRNAGILINKLEKMGVAMLSDSVGLGKTITAGAVIKHYRSEGYKRIIVIVPASLIKQWVDDLANRFQLIEGVDFKIVSQQNIDDMKEISDLDRFKEVDLFVVDEAHNLRNQKSSRYQAVEEWFEGNPSSKVLLLTATPINNSLIDFSNQIQLGLKSSLTSVAVPYINERNVTVVKDFFEALKDIQAIVKKNETSGIKMDWDKYKPTFSKGLSYYLVRSTRQGVEAEGGIISNDGVKRSFPKSIDELINYKSNSDSSSYISNEINKNIDLVFQGINPKKLDLITCIELTQHSQHPLDFIRSSLDDKGYLSKQFSLPENISIVLKEPLETMVPNIFQIINILGFVVYRPEIYNLKYYKKSVSEIRNILANNSDEAIKVRMQFAIHNILHITWLKRLESSIASLQKSILYYQKRLNLFQKYLDLGFIIKIGDIEDIEDEYGENIHNAFSDYDEYLKEIEIAIKNNADPKLIKKYGVERIPLDPKKYNVDGMVNDVKRDQNIVNLLLSLLEVASNPINDSKIIELSKYIKETLSMKKYGKKFLVFSYFADTINYLKEYFSFDSFFKNKVEFITGQTAKVNSIAQRFSPISKNYIISKNETEIDYLFTTDVLSEGQNLQDSGILINYDLHWNPVRMIQRNGRINRLGSLYKEVLIGNFKPSDDLELYLNLVKRLQTKIEMIKYSIGTDQSVLGMEANPIDFVEDIYSADKNKRTEAIKSIDSDSNDVLSWSDEFLTDLRYFLTTNDDNEINRIKSIPSGKWNYLPSSSQESLNTVFSLLKIEGKTTITGEKINETLFFKTNASGDEYQTEYIDDYIALMNIKTTKIDNKRSRDEIRFNRLQICDDAKTLARIKSSTNKQLFNLRRKQIEALEILESYLQKGIKLLSVEKNITTASQLRELNKILNEVNKQQNKNGSIYASTINDFTAFFNSLKDKSLKKQKIENIEGVLYYAKHI